MSEGVAISKHDSKISYSVTSAQDSGLAPEHSQLFVADVKLSAAGPQIANNRMVYESQSKACTIEAQDFYDHDQKMTFTCYEPHNLASVMSIDLKSGKVENMSKAPGTYNECEGALSGRAVHQCRGRPAGGTVRRTARLGKHRHLETAPGRNRQGLYPPDSLQ